MLAAELSSTARRVAIRVAIAAAVLAVLKIIIGFLSGSLAVLSSALDSAGDTVASFINFVFLRIAAKPADEGHPFGHGKAEYLATLFQGVVLLSGAGYLVYRAIHSFSHPEKIEVSLIAIGTMALSTVASFAIGRYLSIRAVSEQSSALEADALHYTSDVVGNLATITALVMVRLTGRGVIDSILAIPIAAWIAWNAGYLIWEASNELMDRSLPHEEIESIIRAIEQAHPSVIGFDNLKTRRAAGERFVEFELWIDREVTFEKAHEVTELVKTMIHEAFPRVLVTVHAEPVEKQCAV